MTWNTILDLDGAVARFDVGGWVEVEVPDDLSGNVKLVTDYQGARFGVESIAGQSTAYAPIIEKQLRDEGVIDDLAEVIVHAAARHGGLTRVFYTVVPSEVILKYRDWAQQYKDFLFVYPLAAVLLKFAQKSGLQDGALLFAHGNQVAVLAFRAGQVIAADSLQYAAGTMQAECGRLAQQVWSLCLENPTNAKPAPLSFLVLQDAGLAQTDVASLCAAIEERAQAQSGTAGVSLSRIAEFTQMFADLPLGIGQIPTLDRVLYVCNKGVPWLAAILAVHLLVTLGMGLHWYLQQSSLQSKLNALELSQVADISGKLGQTVKDAGQIDVEIKKIRKELDAREHARLIPALPVLLSDIRAAAMDKVRVSMVGAVSSNEGGLVSITFDGISPENSFESERMFIQELENRGYKVVKRDVDSSASTGGMFKLSIIRSQ